MNDDWRVRADLREQANARKLSERLEASELEHDLERSFHDRVIVSVDGAELFCYAGTREQAERAERLLRSVAGEHGWHLTTQLERWHPAAEEWEDPDKPLPQSDAERGAEHAEVLERERRESAARGYPEFEVRVQCASHHDTEALAAKLREEGIPSVRRWRFLTIGAADEDAASSLAARIRNEVPAGTIVTAEGTLRAVYEERLPNPFAIFGGMGG